MIKEIKIEEVLSPDRIFIKDYKYKREVLEELINAIYKTKVIESYEELKKEIYRREELMSTGIGLGIGVPHVRLSSVTKMVSALAISTTDIVDYESLDNKPIRIVFMVVASAHQHPQYLRLLSYISSILKREDIRNQILNTRDINKIYEILKTGNIK